VFDQGLSAAPAEWVGHQLADLAGILDRAGVGGDPADDADAQSLRDILPEVLEALRRLIDRVQSGELGRPPAEGPLASARSGWL
jgi:hypothetical protein